MLDEAPIPLKVIAGSPDRLLKIGDIAIPCYVLEGEIRVLSLGGVRQALGLSRTSPRDGGNGVDNIPGFLTANNLKPYVELNITASTKPILFQSPQGGPPAYGYRATLLADFSRVFLDARRAGVLRRDQLHIAEHAELLMIAFAKVGIEALVDEVTDYQSQRGERALAELLEMHVAEELQPWVKTFPDEFYREIYRLKGWRGPIGVERPGIIGHYTNEFVYKRLAPGVFKELQRLNPLMDTGSRPKKHHQYLTPDHGHPRLREHLMGVTALMRAAPTWPALERSIDRAYPVIDTTFRLALGEEDQEGVAREW
jgi:hypothetical protein